MRVCFLTHYFPPEVGAPQTRIELLARTLAADGAEVTVHTGFPHYPDGGVKAPYRNRPWLTERRDGIPIVRSAVYPAANRGFAPQAARPHGVRPLGPGDLALTGSARRRRRRDAHRCSPPPPERSTRRSKGAAYVVNVADRWPASAVELGALRNAAGDRRRRGAGALGLPPGRPVLSPTEGIATTLARRPGRRRQIASRVAGRRPRPVRPGDAESRAMTARLCGSCSPAPSGWPTDSTCSWTPRGSRGRKSCARR